MTPQDAQKQDWDVIIIGAGMGGGLAGRRLAESGQRVLFLERGPIGYRQERHELSAQIQDPVARHIRGYWPKPMQAAIDGRTSVFFAPIGSGVGGSSVFYAAALERPEPHDIDDASDHAHPTGGWPVTYKEFEPYFKQAERILHIRGTADPLSAQDFSCLAEPLQISVGEETMIADFKRQGLQPYRQHLAIQNNVCSPSCLGRKCNAIGCKMDGRSAGVEPALATGKAKLISNCDVLEILENGSCVTGLKINHDSAEVILTAKTYVLAAGALNSPKLLLASTKQHPQGSGNSSGWVGRGLMFHVNELFALWPQRSQAFEGATKAISLRDLYTHKGERLGMIQSMGLEFNYYNIANYLAGLYERSIFRRFKKLRFITNILALITTRILGNAKVFVGILEDLPYFENRVILNAEDRDILAIEYQLTSELKKRRRLFRKQIKRLFRKNRILLLGQSLELNFGHPSGTLRFGNDSATSVCNKECRSHDLSNLYVADASFMPTSMGVNPSLTIAANALRVADIIAKKRSITLSKDTPHA